MSYIPPMIQFHTLSTADGSVTYTSPASTHTLTCGVNYPLEVPFRSDEDPEKTYIEVSLRPHNGVSMVRERYIEEIIRRTLETIVMGEETPRCMLQCTIQVMEMSEDETLPGGIKGGYQGEGCLDLVVGAVNASVLGCLDGAVRMRGLVGAVLIGSLGDGGGITINPDVRRRKQCESLHALAFDTRGRCVLTESEGSFDMETWQIAEQVARDVVCGSSKTSDANGDIDMDAGGHASCLFDTVRQSVEVRVAQDLRWKT